MIKRYTSFSLICFVFANVDIKFPPSMYYNLLQNMLMRKTNSDVLSTIIAQK